MSASIKIEKVGGMLPAWGDRLLPESQAASAVNGYLLSGELVGWRKPKLLRTLTNSAAKFAYRVPTLTRQKARAYLYFASQPNAGDTFTLGEFTYTFTATVNSSSPAFYILIGATAADTAVNTLAAVTLDLDTSTNKGTLYSLQTTLNPHVSLVTGECQTGSFNGHDYVIFTADDYGAANNTIRTLETTSGRVLWLSALDFALPQTTTYVDGTNPTFNNIITGAATWLEFEDQETTVMKSPTVDDQFQRYYFSSPSAPPRYNTYDRIVAGQDPWLLGLDPPGCAPGVSVTGGGSDATLGFPSEDTSGTATLFSNTVYLIPITPSGSMQLDQVNFLPKSTSTTVRYLGLLYDDNGGLPGNLLNVGVINVGTEADLFASSAFVNPTPLTVGVQYWIGVMIDSDVEIADGELDNGDHPTPTGVTFFQSFSNGPPAVAPQGSMSTGLVNLNVYGDMTTSDVIAARAYVYTWVTEYGEESAASPSTLVNGWSNGKWHIELCQPPAADMGLDRNITKLRLYRTVSGSSTTVFFFVAELPIGTASYDDVALDDVISLNDEISTLNFFPPPEGLQGILSMPNGVIAGFKGNQIWFAEPYSPHAWPPGYVLTTEYPIVGLGVTGQTLVVATTATPYTCQVVHPSTATIQKGGVKEPCVSGRSIVSTDNGVFYVSLNGLIMVTPSGLAGNATEMWITREKWAQLVPTTRSVTAIPFSSSYFAFGTTDGSDVSVAQSGFTIEMNQDTESFSVWPQPGGHRLGLMRLSAPNLFNIDNVLLDPWAGVCLLIQNGAIYYYDFTDGAPEMVPYTWRSKKFQQNNRKNYEAIKIYFDVPANTPVQGDRQTLPFDDPTWNTLGANQYGIVRVYADDRLVMAREIYTSGELLRIPSGFKCETWQFEFTARVNITNVQIALTAKQLSNI